MLDLLEKIVWGLTIFAIVALAAGISYVGGPSPYHDSELATTQIESAPAQEAIEKAIKIEFDGEQERLTKEHGENAKTYRVKDGVKIPEYRIDEKTGIPKYVAPVHAAGTQPKKSYMLLDRRIKEKYSNFQDVFQMAQYAESVFATDSNGMPVLEVTHVAKNSIIEKVGFRKGDVVYSICGFTARNEDEAYKLYQELKTRDIFSVELVRDTGGVKQKMTMNFRFGD